MAGRGEDVLLTLEHDPPVLTAGRRATDAGLVDPDRFERRTIERGGEWTYHGPGQLVAYPIVAIRGWGLRVTEFVAGLETAMAALVAEAVPGVEVGRRCDFPGAWVRRAGADLAKVGAVGVHFRRFVSLHGLALNVDPDPWGFDAIVPCGLSDEVTSIARLGGDVPTIADAADRLAELLPAAWRGELRAARSFGSE